MSWRHRGSPLRRPLACILLLMLAACHEDVATAPAPVRPVLVADVQRQTTHVFGPFAGTIEPRFESKQGFRASRRMITRDVEVGDIVHRGQTLASLDDTLLNFAVVRAESSVVDAKAQLDRAGAADERKRNLIKSGAVPQSDVDTANADEKTATAKLDQGKATLQKDKDQLGYAVLHAEYNGVIIAWTAEVGQDVSEGQNVVTIAQPDLREAVVDIPDNLIGDVKRTAVFDVRLQSAGKLVAKAIVREIAPAADPATRTRRVKFTLQGPSDAFRIGSTISVSLTRPIDPRTLIPVSAIFERDGRKAVWIVASDDDKVALRDVAETAREDGFATVTGDLGPSDRVVVAGVHELEPGRVVRAETSFP